MTDAEHAKGETDCQLNEKVMITQNEWNSGLYYKSFTIVIYDNIDSGQYYKTMIMIVSYAPHSTLALSSIVNYDRKWRHNLEHHLLMIVKTFIVQATERITNWKNGTTYFCAMELCIFV